MEINYFACVENVLIAKHSFSLEKVFLYLADSCENCRCNFCPSPEKLPQMQLISWIDPCSWNFSCFLHLSFFRSTMNIVQSRTAFMQNNLALQTTSFLSSSTPWHCLPQEEDMSLKIIFHVENQEIVMVAWVKFLVAYKK